jgi:hypothetical protein
VFDWTKLKERRFSAYELEKSIVSLLSSNRSAAAGTGWPQDKKATRSGVKRAKRVTSD